MAIITSVRFFSVPLFLEARCTMHESARASAMEVTGHLYVELDQEYISKEAFDELYDGYVPRCGLDRKHETEIMRWRPIPPSRIIDKRAVISGGLR